MLFEPASILHFHFFRCHLVSHLGSLLQKCDPDRCDHNSHKSRLCFFTHQTFSIFIHLVFTWCPNLDPCCKSVILACAIKNYIKVVYVFLVGQAFPYCVPSAVPWRPMSPGWSSHAKNLSQGKTSVQGILWHLIPWNPSQIKQIPCQTAPQLGRPSSIQIRTETYQNRDPPWTINPLSIFRCSGLFLGTTFWHRSAESGF